MKKRFLTFCVVLPASVLLFLNIAPVHSSHARPVWRNGVSQADGVPLPPPPRSPTPLSSPTAFLCLRRPRSPTPFSQQMACHSRHPLRSPTRTSSSRFQTLQNSPNLAGALYHWPPLLFTPKLCYARLGAEWSNLNTSATLRGP